MGALLLVSSVRSTHDRAATLTRMAERSPYRGDLLATHWHGISIAVQARQLEASLLETPSYIVAVHGRAFDIAAGPIREEEKTSASIIAEAWTTQGRDTLTRLDGEYALCLLDKQTGTTYLSVSLMLTKPLYHARHDDLLCVAPEIRQCAAGAGIAMRLDPAQVAMSYWLGGPLLERHRTEYLGIDRLLAPRIYRISNGSTEPVDAGCYYAPPAELPERVLGDGTAAARDLIAGLETAVSGLPKGTTALSLSAGHDSGLLYHILRNRGELDLEPRLYGFTYPDSTDDERPAIEALARQYQDSVAFVQATDATFAEASRAFLGEVDGIPQTPTVANSASLAHRAAADGMTHFMTGMGAEAALAVAPGFLLDLLYERRLLSFLHDVLSYRPYTVRGKPWHCHVRYMLRALLAPKDSVFGRWHERRRVRAAGDRWQPMLAQGFVAYIEARRDATYGRAQRLLQLDFHSLLSGSERLEQHFEWHGVHLVQPYVYRPVVQVGLETPARILSGGRYDKFLQRQAASLVLGRDPGWPWGKTAAAAINEPMRGADIEAFGPPGRWRLVELEILNRATASSIARGKRGWLMLSQTLHFERYLRHYGT